MIARRHLLYALLTASHAIGVMAADVESGLRHDPFARPDLALAPGSTAKANEVAATEWKPKLRAVIVAGKNSIVNVEGTIVPLGGQIDGFRLTGVEERKAVFMKDGVRVELTTDNEKMGGK